MPEVVVTNLTRNLTGVSATAANVVRVQKGMYDLVLAGYPLPGCPMPVSRREATRLSATPAAGRSCTIWHVRRNPDMRAALWARDVLRLPIKTVYTAVKRGRRSSIMRWLIGRMDAVVAVSEEAARFVPHCRAIVPHGVDLERFRPGEDRAAAWRESGFPGQGGVATIGRIRPEKGTDRFVAAMLEWLPTHPEVTALVLGRASRRDQGFLDDLQRQVAAAGLGGRLLFPGELAPDDLARVLRGLSAVVQLPRYEGFGMVPLEGMASGVPFVASDQGYYREFSDRGRCGTVVAGDDPGEVARALSDMLDSPDRHASMADAALERARTHFSSVAEARGIGAVYEQLWGEAD